MSQIKFSLQQKTAIASKLQDYFEQELAQELGQFDAEFLIDFISKEIGSFYYNQGLLDARAILASKIQMIDEDISAIEKDTD